MTKISVELYPLFHQSLDDNYVQTSTTYTAETTFWGDIKVSSSPNYSYSGTTLSTYYSIEGELEYSTDQPIKYIYFSVLLYNRVKDSIGKVDYSYMGPFHGSNSFNLHKTFGDGLPNGTIVYMGISSVSCDFMDGTSGQVQLGVFNPVEVLPLETEEGRRAELEPDTLTYIALINLFLSPIAGALWSGYQYIQGYKTIAKEYFKFTAKFSLLYIIPFFIYLVAHIIGIM